MSDLEVPIICVVIGEGSSGGALAIGVGDKILMLENSIYSVLSPEGFASILYKDSSLYKKAAKEMKITAKDLKKLGIIDEIIKEDDILENTKKAIAKNLKELLSLDKNKLVENRYQKYRNIGKGEENDIKG